MKKDLKKYLCPYCGYEYKFYSPIDRLGEDELWYCADGCRKPTVFWLSDGDPRIPDFQKKFKWGIPTVMKKGEK